MASVSAFAASSDYRLRLIARDAKQSDARCTSLCRRACFAGCDNGGLPITPRMPGLITHARQPLAG